MTLIERIVELDGTITEKPYSEEQLAEVEREKIKAAERVAAMAKAEADKAALLAKLGITADEAALLLG